MSKKKDQGGKKEPLNKPESNSPLRMNRGVELLLRNKKGRDLKTSESKVLEGRSKMIAVTLTLSTVISIMFLLVGGVIGYLLKEYVIERNSTFIPTHPEMFDEHGQIIPDDILAVRFENGPETFLEDEE
tara:strand:- start:1338 stop:1724 length:387 start_codon:yes stop_codon:yes gene_type:complete